MAAVHVSAAPQDHIVLLDDTADALIWMSRSDGSISKTESLPNAGDGAFRALSLDESGNAFVIQEVDASLEGRVVFYKEADGSFQTLAQFTGYQPGYRDIEWAGNDNVLVGTARLRMKK